MAKKTASKKKAKKAKKADATKPGTELPPIPKEMKEKVEKLQKKLDTFKDKVLSKFDKYITSMALLPPPKPKQEPGQPVSSIVATLLGLRRGGLLLGQLAIELLELAVQLARLGCLALLVLLQRLAHTLGDQLGLLLGLPRALGGPGHFHRLFLDHLVRLLLRSGRCHQWFPLIPVNSRQSGQELTA